MASKSILDSKFFNKLQINKLQAVETKILNKVKEEKFLFSLEIQEAYFKDKNTLYFEKINNNYNLITFSDRPFRYSNTVFGQDAIKQLENLYNENTRNNFKDDPPNGVIVTDKFQATFILEGISITNSVIYFHIISIGDNNPLDNLNDFKLETARTVLFIDDAISTGNDNVDTINYPELSTELIKELMNRSDGQTTTVTSESSKETWFTVRSFNYESTGVSVTINQYQIYNKGIVYATILNYVELNKQWIKYSTDNSYLLSSQLELTAAPDDADARASAAQLIYTNFILYFSDLDNSDLLPSIPFYKRPTTVTESIAYVNSRTPIDSEASRQLIQVTALTDSRGSTDYGFKVKYLSDDIFTINDKEGEYFRIIKDYYNDQDS